MPESIALLQPSETAATATHQELDALRRMAYLSSDQWVTGITNLVNIGHKSTAASLYSANVLLQNYKMDPLPGCHLDPSSKHLAVLLDVCMSLHYVPEALATAGDLLRDIQDETRTENAYGTLTRAQVTEVQAQATGARADRVFAVLHNIAVLHDKMPTFGNGAGLGGSSWITNKDGDLRMTGYRPTAAATGVTQVLLRLFHLESKRPKWKAEQQHIAILIDSCASAHYLPQDLADAKRILLEIRDEIRGFDPIGLMQPEEVSRATQAATAKRSARIFTVLNKATLLHNRLPSYGR